MPDTSSGCGGVSGCEDTADQGLPSEPTRLAQLSDAEDPIGERLERERAEEARTAQSEPREAAQPSFEIGLPLLMDERYLGDVTVRVQGDSVSVRSDSLLRLLQPDLSAASLDALRASVLDDYLEIGTFMVEGVEIDYNPGEQQIEVSTPLDMRQRRTLRYGVEDARPDLAVEEPGDVSLFVNLFASTGYDWDRRLGPDRFQDVRGAVDIGGRLFGENGVGFLSRQSYDTERDFRMVREETIAFYDLPGSLLRLSAGDLRYRGASFQRTPLIGGLAIERFFDLEPNRVFRPVGEASFDLDRPSTVELRINGVTQQEYLLPVGRFDLNDLPLVQGSNLVELVVRDDLGRERVISDRNFFDFDLLETGITDFSLAAGVKTRFTDAGAIDYSDQLAASAFVRHGVSDTLTLGLNAQGDESGFTSGGSALFASDLGVLGVEASFSDYTDRGSGYAGELSYRAIGGRRGDASWTLTGSAQYFSENFDTLRSDGDRAISIVPTIDDGDVFDPVRRDVFQPFAARLLGSARMQWRRLSATVTASHSVGRREQSDRTSLIGGFNYAFAPRLTAGLFARYAETDTESETALLAQLNWRIGRNRDLRTTYDSGLNEVTTRYNRTSQRGIGALSYSVNGRYNGDFDSAQLGGSANYLGNRFEASLDHSVLQAAPSLGEDGRELSQLTRASLGTSLVFVDGAFGIGRPVDNTFTILQADRTLRGRRVLVNPTLNGVTNRSDFLGPAVITEGQSFAQRSTYYDVEDLPVGYDLGEGQYTIKAPIFAGYKIKVGGAASYTMVGNVVGGPADEPVAYLGGSITATDRPDDAPIPAFTNRNGRLAATGLAPGRYRLTLQSEPPVTRDFTIVPDDDALFQIGTIDVGTQP